MAKKNPDKWRCLTVRRETHADLVALAGVLRAELGVPVTLLGAVGKAVSEALERRATND